MEETIPFHLTAGIFFDLLLEARKRPVGNQNECFRDLLRIYDRNTADALTGSSLKTITSRMRNCNPDLAGSDYIHFGDPMTVDSFENKIRTSYEDVEKEMAAYSDRYLDLSVNGEWLFRALLEIVEADDGIPDNERIYINAEGTEKKNLRTIRRVEAYGFLLGMWDLVCRRKYAGYREEYLALTEDCGARRPRRLRKELIGNTGYPDLRIVFWVDTKEQGCAKKAAEALPEPARCCPERIDPRRFRVYLKRAKERHWKKKTYFYETGRPFYDFFVCSDVFIREGRGTEWPADREDPEAYIENICIEKLPDGHHFIILTGAGGIGKTMMMIHLLLDTIMKSGTSGRIPVYVVLRHYDVPKQSLLEFVFSEMQRHDPSLEMDDFLELLKSGNAVLLMDGVDEIRHDWREKFYQEMDTFTDSYPENVFVLSSRPSIDFRILSRFVVYDLQPFSRGQAIRMIEKLDQAEVEEEIRRDFIRDFREKRFCFAYDSDAEFLRNPMLLVILFLTYERSHSIPTQQFMFYQEAYDALAQKHDAAKALSRPFVTGLSSREFKRFFGEFCMLSYYDERYSLYYDKAMEYFRRVISVNGLQTSPEAFFQDITEKLCLMFLDGREYAFLHRSFQEFFVAYYFARQIEQKFDVVLDMLLKFDRTNPDSMVLSFLYDMEREKTELCVFIPFLERLLGSYRGFLEKVYPVITCVSAPYYSSESGIYQFIASKFDLQIEMREDVVDGLDEGFKREYLCNKKRYVVGGRRRDENGNFISGTERYASQLELAKILGTDFQLTYEIRVAEMYDNPEVCGEVIRILEDETFPMRVEYRKACRVLDELRKKYMKKEPVEDILARFH